jgi:hypothetical protein
LRNAGVTADAVILSMAPVALIAAVALAALARTARDQA